MSLWHWLTGGLVSRIEELELRVDALESSVSVSRSALHAIIESHNNEQQK